MSQKIALFTDSTSNIPSDLIKKYDITVVPQVLIWGQEEFRDQIDIDSSTFYARLQKDPVHPTTSQPTVANFKEYFDKAIADGAEEIVIVHLSKELSGTYQSVMGAKEAANYPVHAFDSLSAGMGLGWQVLAAARAREDGADPDGMIAAAKKTRETLHLTLMVDTLEYLHKGGRIGGARRLIGTALDIKPQLFLDHEAGKLMPGKSTRTRRRALESVYDSFFEEMKTDKPMHIAVMHVDSEKDALKFKERIEKEYSPVESVLIEITPVVGVHVGPGTVGIAGYYEP